MINYSENGGVVRIELNRPEKRNALSIELLEQIKKSLIRANGARVMVLSGTGKVFCSGMDLNEVQDSSNLQKIAGLLADVYRTLYAMPCVTVAAVHGAAVGGGAGLVGACDIAIADEGALFGYPEVRRGIIPSQVMSFLVRQVPGRTVRELVLLGEMITAEKAKEFGLINRVTSNLSEEVNRVVSSALEGAPNAILETKALIDQVNPGVFNDDLMKGFDLSIRTNNSEEMKEGIEAFLMQRKPRWQS